MFLCLRVTEAIGSKLAKPSATYLFVIVFCFKVNSIMKQCAAEGLTVVLRNTEQLFNELSSLRYRVILHRDLLK